MFTTNLESSLKLSMVGRNGGLLWSAIVVLVRQWRASTTSILEPYILRKRMPGSGTLLPSIAKLKKSPGCI
jgi:hypothetical protein